MSTTRSNVWLSLCDRRRVLVLILFGILTLAAPSPAALAGGKARQVTISGIIATPDSTAIDPKLAKIEPQLRKLLPNHGFKLLDVRTRRLVVGQSVVCNLGAGYEAEALLLDSLDDNGKVRLKCDVTLSTIPQTSTTVTTPPNQLFFWDQKLDDGSHLLIGVGAR